MSKQYREDRKVIYKIGAIGGAIAGILVFPMIILSAASTPLEGLLWWFTIISGTAAGAAFGVVIVHMIFIAKTD